MLFDFELSARKVTSWTTFLLGFRGEVFREGVGACWAGERGDEEGWEG